MTVLSIAFLPLFIHPMKFGDAIKLLLMARCLAAPVSSRPTKALHQQR
jgi:hypothetical protein